MSSATATFGRGHVLLSVAASSVLAVPAAAASPVPIVAGPEGRVRLAELAGGGISLPGARAAEARSFRFNFPLGSTSQGPDTWYLIRLDVSVAFEPGSSSGSVLISGFSRGQAGAQVEFYPGRTKRGRPFVRWESVDLIRGQAAGASRGHEARVRYLNYLPYAGVRPGPATLTLQLERLGGAEVSEVRIGAASGVYATPAGPVELKLDASIPDRQTLATGEPARLEVEVSNTSTRPAEDVVVALMPQTGHMFVDGTPRRTIKSLEGSETVEFTVGRSRPGTLRVKAIAGAPNGAEAQTVLEAEVGGGDEGEGFRPWIVLALAAAAGLGAMALTRRPKQKERKS